MVNGVTRRYEITASRENLLNVITSHITDSLTGQQARSSTTEWIFDGFPNPADLGKPAPKGWKFPIVVLPFPEPRSEPLTQDSGVLKIMHTFSIECHSRDKEEANQLAEQIKYLIEVTGFDSLRNATLHYKGQLGAVNQVGFIGGNKYYTKIIEYQFQRVD